MFVKNFDMKYFNYHAKAKKLILQGKLKSYEIVDEYNGIKPALILFFENNKPMPIRIHKWEEYFELFEKIHMKKDE